MFRLCIQVLRGSNGYVYCPLLRQVLVLLIVFGQYRYDCLPNDRHGMVRPTILFSIVDSEDRMLTLLVVRRSIQIQPFFIRISGASWGQHS